MRPSLRFLAIAMVGWAGVRVATLGAVPGGAVLPILPGPRAVPQPSAIVPTEFPAIAPVAPAIPQAGSAMTPPIAI